MKSKFWFVVYSLFCKAPFIIPAMLLGYAIGYAVGFTCWIAEAFVDEFRRGREDGGKETEYEPQPTNYGRGIL